MFDSDNESAEGGNGLEVSREVTGPRVVEENSGDHIAANTPDEREVGGPPEGKRTGSGKQFSAELDDFPDELAAPPEESFRLRISLVSMKGPNMGLLLRRMIRPNLFSLP